MVIYFVFGLLTLLMPLVLLSVVAEMTIKKFLALVAVCFLFLIIYYDFSIDFFNMRYTKIVIILFLLFLTIIVFFANLLNRRKSQNNIKNLKWDEEMKVEVLAYIVEIYFRSIGWKVVKMKSPVEFRMEFGTSIFATMIYTSDMPRFYDSTKICDFIQSDTRAIRDREKVQFAVIAMFNLSTFAREELKSQNIQFVFYKELSEFVSNVVK